jgi:hypothetical protein
MCHQIQYSKRKEMCVQCNNVERSCHHCCNGKEISITYSENVFVALGIQDPMGMGHIVICRLPGPTIFFQIFL